MIRIRGAVLDEVVGHARRAAPQECCGLLIGAGDLIDGCRPARNLKESPVAFLVDPADHFAAIREARQGGRAVLGAYHSHPRTAPVPSPTDLAEWHDPALLQLIVSLAAPVPAVAAFRLERGSAIQVPVERVDG